MTTPTITAPAPSATTAETLAPPEPTAAGPARRRFTADEYYAMDRAGIFGPEERLELLDGDIFVMPPIGDPHAYSVDELVENFTLAHQGRARVRAQNPLRLDDHSVPQPDIMLLRRRDDLYRTGPPRPADVLLLIEVSDSTLSFDQNQKLPQYAAAGIPEVWIVNRPDRRVESYADPDGDEYATVRHYGAGERIAPRAFPDVMLDVDRIIGG